MKKFSLKRLSLRSIFVLIAVLACCTLLVRDYWHKRSQPAMCYMFCNLHWDSDLNRGMDLVCAFRGSGRFDPPHKCAKVVFLHKITKPRHLLKRKRQLDADGITDITALLATDVARDSGGDDLPDKYSELISAAQAGDLPMSSVLGWLEYKPGADSFYMKCNGQRVMPREDSLLVLFMTDDTKPSWRWVPYSDVSAGDGIYPDFEALWKFHPDSEAGN